MKTKDIGDLGEKIAAKHLKSKKYKIVAKNIHISRNELDIIAIKKREGIIAFVEVKTRSVDEDMHSKFGVPSSSVTKQKQERTITATRAYLTHNPKFKTLQPRLDVIEIYLHKDNQKVLNINHIENAFGV
jgi:putative endonuclease